MILKLLCVCLVFYSLLLSLMHGTMNLKWKVYVYFFIDKLQYCKLIVWIEVVEFYFNFFVTI
jgi:hypothetical protein